MEHGKSIDMKGIVNNNETHNAKSSSLCYTRKRKCCGDGCAVQDRRKTEIHGFGAISRVFARCRVCGFPKVLRTNLTEAIRECSRASTKDGDCHD